MSDQKKTEVQNTGYPYPYNYPYQNGGGYNYPYPGGLQAGPGLYPGYGGPPPCYNSPNMDPRFFGQYPGMMNPYGYPGPGNMGYPGLGNMGYSGLGNIGAPSMPILSKEDQEKQDKAHMEQCKSYYEQMEGPWANF